jgi:hypothetical protein
MADDKPPFRQAVNMTKVQSRGALKDNRNDQIGESQDSAVLIERFKADQERERSIQAHERTIQEKYKTEQLRLWVEMWSEREGASSSRSSTRYGKNTAKKGAGYH